MARLSLARCSRCQHLLTNHLGPDECYDCAGYTRERYAKPVRCKVPAPDQA